MTATEHLTVRFERTVSFEFETAAAGPADLRALAAALERDVAPRADADRVAHAVWRGLLDGRWTILDSFEVDDRRYLLARERPGPSASAALTERERQVVELAVRGHSNKFAALELGLTASTVATHLRRAMTKLGLDTRAALVQALPLAALLEELS